MCSNKLPAVQIFDVNYRRCRVQDMPDILTQIFKWKRSISLSIKYLFDLRDK